MDNRLDELVRRAASPGWQPLVKSLSRRSGEYIYIYAQANGNEMKLLLVSVEREVQSHLLRSTEQRHRTARCYVVHVSGFGRGSPSPRSPFLDSSLRPKWTSAVAR